MAGVRAEDGKKWINAFVAIISILVGYIAIQFFGQLSEWFDLEAKIKYFLAVKQISGVVLGLLTGIYITKNKQAYSHMNEVYNELVKVVWPEKDTVVKLTVGIVVGVTIISSIFVGIDYLFRTVLDLLY